MCDDKKMSVSYMLVCDTKVDCLDSSDENFCTYLECSKGYFDCGQGQV